MKVNGEETFYSYMYIRKRRLWQCLKSYKLSGQLGHMQMELVSPLWSLNKKILKVSLRNKVITFNVFLHSNLFSVYLHLV